MINQETQDFLAHHGVLGMHWGRRKPSVEAQAAANRAAGAASKKGFFNRPNAAKAALLGSYGKKSSYTDPHALAIRRAAGKVRIAALVANLGSTAAGITASSLPNLGSGSQVKLGASYISQLLGIVGSVGIVGATVTGAVGAHTENVARQNG